MVCSDTEAVLWWVATVVGSYYGDTEVEVCSYTVVILRLWWVATAWLGNTTRHGGLLIPTHTTQYYNIM